MKVSYIFLLTLSVLYAKENPLALQHIGIKWIDHNRTFMIERKEDMRCFDIAVTPENILGQGLSKLHEQCTHKVVKTVGIIQPMRLDPKIETVGEIEVLAFVKHMLEKPEKYILIDARKSQWYRFSTIPGAINIPYDEIAYDSDFPEEHTRLLKLLHIKRGEKGIYTFDNAKKILVFCNGAWCAQSAKAIAQLVKIGYPKEKILWYRGGIQDWLSLGFETIKP